MTTQRRFALRRNVTALIIGCTLASVAVVSADEAPRGGTTNQAKYRLVESLAERAPYRLVIRNWTSGDECGRLRLLAFEPDRSRSVYRCVNQ